MREGLDSISLSPCGPSCLFVSSLLTTALLRLQTQGGNRGGGGGGPLRGLEPRLGPSLGPLVLRGCGPGVGREKGTGRGFQPLVAL